MRCFPWAFGRGPAVTRQDGLSDTTPEARRVQIAALRAMGVEGRARAMLDLNRLAREFALAGIRTRHPDYDDEKVRRAFFRLTFGRKLFREVYGDAEVKP